MSNKEFIVFKGKPLVRNDDVLYYGNAEDPVIVLLEVKGRVDEKDLHLPTRVVVSLMTNNAGSKAKLIKRAERDSLFKALDIGEFWLRDYLEKLSEA